MQKRINFEYLGLWREIFLFWLLFFRKKKKATEKSNKILIVNPCLIGEFVISLPAISDFIQRNKDKIIDIIVSPPLKPLAERIIGIKNVFVVTPEIKLPDIYEKIIIIRINWNSYNAIKNLKANEIKNSTWLISKYVLHLFKSVMFGRVPKQWREFNFEMLGGTSRNVNFSEIFDFKNEDYNKIKKLDELQTTEKKIIIHTGSNWLMKKWDNEKWIELIKKIYNLGNFRFIFIGTKDNEKDYAYISSKLDFKIYSLIGKINLMELMLVLKSTDYFIGVDSGPKNMAYLADLPSIAILGPGPHFYMPFDKNHIALDKSNGRGLYQFYFYKKNSFIQKIKVNEVYEAFLKLIC